MACCGRGSNPDVEFEVRFSGGRTQRYATMAEAQAAQAKAGGTGTSIRAVPKGR